MSICCSFGDISRSLALIARYDWLIKHAAIAAESVVGEDVLLILRKGARRFASELGASRLQQLIRNMA